MTAITAPTDEADFVTLLKSGDRGAYRQAVRTYAPVMLAVARYYVPPDKAEDVVQDGWIKAVRAIEQFEGRSSLKTWLCRIVANQAKNSLRQSDREIPVDFNSDLEPELANRFGSGRFWTSPPPKTAESAEQWLENAALQACLAKHLSSMPERQRSALLLFEAHQHKTDEVCNILEVSTANLHLLVHRARQRIFLMVENFEETGEC